MIFFAPYIQYSGWERVNVQLFFGGLVVWFVGVAGIEEAWGA